MVDVKVSRAKDSSMFTMTVDSDTKYLVAKFIENMLGYHA